MSEQKLQKALGFDDSDLSANRAGQLTSRQAKAVSRSEQLDTIISLSLGTIFILVAAFFSYGPISSLVSSGASLTSLSANDLKLLAIPGILWLIMGTFSMIYFIKAFKKTGRAVMNAKGKVSFVKVERRVEDSNGHFLHDEMHYDMHVGQVNFNSINENLLNVIDPDDTYVFYYVEGFGILSGESVR